MRTIETKLYSFNELSQQAKQKAMDKWLQNEDYYHVYNEANETVKKFHEIFGTKDDSDRQYDFYSGHIDDDIIHMKGLRLQKYLWNNYRNDLFKGKYYSTQGQWINGKYHYKYRHSNIILKHCCVLTGVCYDDSILQPIYDFLDCKGDYLNTDLEDLFNECFSALNRDINNEVEAMQTEEYLSEHFEINEYEFHENGERY